LQAQFDPRRLDLIAVRKIGQRPWQCPRKEWLGRGEAIVTLTPMELSNNLLPAAGKNKDAVGISGEAQTTQMRPKGSLQGGLRIEWLCNCCLFSGHAQRPVLCEQSSRRPQPRAILHNLKVI
jgi:hypothetical protein